MKPRKTGDVIISHSDNEKKTVPNSIYKYTKIEYIKSCVENGIYASRIDQVNDPYESDGIENPDLYRIACLTTASTQMLMWAYYGNHHGCSIQYDVSQIPLSILRRANFGRTEQPFRN